MRIPTETDMAREVTDYKAGWFGLLLMIGGALIAANSVNITPNWLAASVLTLGGSIISIGAISLFFEVALRRSVYNEMYKLSGLNRNIAENQYAGSAKYGEIKWDDIFFERSNFVFILQDPLRFVEQNFSKLLESARDRPIQVRFIIPDTADEFVTPLAILLSADPTELAASIDRSVQRIEAAWIHRRDREQIALGSSIEVRAAAAFPIYSLAACDSLTVVTIPGPFGRTADVSEYCYVHLGNQKSFPTEWFREEVKEVEASPIRFANEVR